MSRKKRILTGILAALGILILVLAVTPVLYRHHATGELARQLNEKYGKNGWVAAWVVSDRQFGEQINLYRTVYLKLLYPKCLAFTPYKKLEFTHGTEWANMPPHYAVLVYSADGEFAYRWSIKKDGWYISYQNSITILPPWDKEKILGKLRTIERVDGLNVSKAQENET